MIDRGDSSARLLDGRSIARTMIAQTRRQLADLSHTAGFAPEVRIVLVGEDPASAMYARRIVRSAAEVGSRGAVMQLAEGATAASVRAALREASRDSLV